VRRLALAAVLACAGLAHAEGFDKLAEGAPAYAALRPLSFAAALKRLGVGELPEVQSLRRQLGGIDPLEPALLGPTGLDVAAPMVASGYQAVAGKPLLRYHRLVATLRDPAMFNLFITGVAASKQAPLQITDPASALGKLGVIAALEDRDINLIVRLSGDLAVVDAVTPEHGPGMTPLQIARKYPLTPRRAFKPERGARRLFAPDAGAVLYVDGRRLLPVLEAMEGKGHGKNGRSACGLEWQKASTTFDDVAISLSVDPDGIGFSLAWGTQGGAPLGGLKLKAVDDHAWDLDLLGRTAPWLMALYAADLKPFSALKRLGPLATATTLSQSALRCGAPAWGTLLARSWPNALGALVAEAKAPKGPDPATQALSAFGNLRTLVLALRDATPQGPKWMMGATLDAAARPLIEVLLGTVTQGRSGVQTPLGGRATVVYHADAVGTPVAAALESLAAGPLAFTVADSDEGLGWAYRTAVRMPGAPPPPPPVGPTPLLMARFDTPALARLAPMLKLGRQVDQLFDRAAKLRRLDADLISDGDLLRLTVRAPVKQ